MFHQRSLDVVFLHQPYGTSCHACLPLFFTGRHATSLVTSWFTGRDVTGRSLPSSVFYLRPHPALTKAYFGAGSFTLNQHAVQTIPAQLPVWITSSFNREVKCTYSNFIYKPDFFFGEVDLSSFQIQGVP